MVYIVLLCYFYCWINERNVMQSNKSYGVFTCVYLQSPIRNR